VAFDSRGRLLASGGWDGTFRLWDPTRAKREPTVVQAPGGLIWTLAFDPLARWLATASEDATARLWDPADPTAGPIELRAHGGRVSAGLNIAFDPRGRWLATARQGGYVHLWELDDLDSSPVELATDAAASVAGRGIGVCLAFGPQGRWLAAGGLDRNARNTYLWLTDRIAAGPEVLKGHRGPVSAIDFDPEGRWLATGSWDGTLRLWPLRLPELLRLACSTAGRALTAKEWERHLGDLPRRSTCAGLPGGATR
jgi:WD40 repeat protein